MWLGPENGRFESSSLFKGFTGYFLGGITHMVMRNGEDRRGHSYHQGSNWEGKRAKSVFRKETLVLMNVNTGLSALPHLTGCRVTEKP